MGRKVDMRTVYTFLPLAIALIAVLCRNVGAQGGNIYHELPPPEPHRVAVVAQSRLTNRLHELPGLKDCSPDLPCEYGEGDCGRLGDEGCGSGLVCGVSNCGSFITGMYGSCCAQPSHPTYEIEDVPDSQAQGGITEWGPWYPDNQGWGRKRKRLVRSYYVIQRQELN